MQKLRKHNISIFLNAENVQNTCEVCGFLARDRDDLVSIKEEGACTECVLNFKHVMADEWKKGQRPTLEVARKRMNIFIGEV